MLHFLGLECHSCLDKKTNEKCNNTITCTSPTAVCVTQLQRFDFTGNVYQKVSPNMENRYADNIAFISKYI